MKPPKKGVLRVGRAELDYEGRRLVVPGRPPLSLTAKETALIRCLMSADRPLPKGVLHKKAFGAWARPESSVVKVHICSVRRKLGRFHALIVGDRSGRYAFDRTALKGRAG